MTLRYKKDPKKHRRLPVVGLLRPALERGHAGSHDLIDEQEVAGDDGAGVDHLAFNVVVVVDAEVRRIDHFSS
jgi:hypothetical protein